MAEAAVCFLLEQLRGHREKEFEPIIDDLDVLRALLHDASSKKSTVFREIERQIREVVYDVEDTIDVCLAAQALSKLPPLLRRLSPNHISMDKQIKLLRQKKLIPMLQRARVDFANFKDVGGGPPDSEEDDDDDDDDEHQKRLMYMNKDITIRQDFVVGFTDEVNSIINHLREPKDEFNVISIIGMAGLGKTTLAWKVFENEVVRCEFPTRIWVHVSQRFDCKNVFLNILRCFESDEMMQQHEMHNTVELGMRVRSCLEESKFLLVLDDVWSIEVWNTLKDVLPHRKVGTQSKVVITTRDVTVGRYAGEAHILGFLTSDQSWQLLQIEVFLHSSDCPPQLEKIGQRIAHLCGGVPLQILEIGRILKEEVITRGSLRLVAEAWEAVYNNIMPQFQRRGTRNYIIDTVALSYYNLPDYLRECFLYLGVFPVDYEIETWTLIRLWIAEGFVVATKGVKSLEDTATQYLYQLIARNLLMVVGKNPMGDIKTCRVHTMIQAFCKSKASEENLFQEIKYSSGGEFELNVSEISKFRRLSLQSLCLSTFLRENPNCPQLRSLLSLYKDPSLLDSSSCIGPDAFTLLRILESKATKFDQFPQRITKLIHLRYLTLSVDDIALPVIPEPISQLWNLQTLVVETKVARTIIMKASIWSMIRLRHLKTKAALVLQEKPHKDAAATHHDKLQTITTLSSDSCTPDFVEKAHYLETLGVRGTLATFFETMPLGKLNRLQKLKLVNDSESQILCLPEPRCFPPKLKRLTLSKTYLDWKHMSTLAMITTLEVLKLKDDAFTGTSWTIHAYGFPNLQFLFIVNTDLITWEASPDNFPTLSFLLLKKCKNLVEIPQCLAQNLKVLEIDSVSKSATDSAIKIQQVIHQQHKQGDQFKLIIKQSTSDSIDPSIDTA